VETAHRPLQSGQTAGVAQAGQPFRGILGGGGQAAQSGPKPIRQGVLNGGADRAASGAVLPGGFQRRQQRVRGHDTVPQLPGEQGLRLVETEAPAVAGAAAVFQGCDQAYGGGDPWQVHSHSAALPNVRPRAEALPLDQGGYPAFSQLPGQCLSGIGREQGGQLLRLLFRRRIRRWGGGFPGRGSCLGGLFLQP